MFEAVGRASRTEESIVDVGLRLSPNHRQGWSRQWIRNWFAARVWTDTKPMPSSDISVVIPFHNASATVITCLQALETSSLRPLEVICVDDASADDSVSRIEQFSKTSCLGTAVIEPPACKRGAAAARNSGAQAARGDFVLFLDADVVVEPDTVQVLMDHMKEHACQAVVAMFRDFSLRAGLLAGFQAYVVNNMYADLRPHDSPCLGTQCVLMRSKTFHATSGFNEKYGHATVEDFEFGYSLRRRGGRIHIATEAGIVHNHSYNVSAFLKNYYSKARDLARLLLKNPSIDLRHSGYYEIRDLWTILTVLMGFLGLLTGLAVHRRALGLSLVSLIILPALWFRFFSQAAGRWGIPRAGAFTALRSLVALVGGAGCLAAALIVLMEERPAFATWCGLLYGRLTEALTPAGSSRNAN